MKKTSILTSIFALLLAISVALSGCSADSLTGPEVSGETIEQTRTLDAPSSSTNGDDNDGSTTYHPGHNTSPEDG